jgi:hypothetical protein
LQILDLKLYDKDGSNKKECVLITESEYRSWFIYIFKFTLCEQHMSFLRAKL